MTSYAPIFSKIVDSSLWSEEDYVCKAFVTLLAIKNSDHVARINAFALGRKCWPNDLKGSERRALDALKILSSPDTKRIEPQPFEGRRIEKVDDGWLVLNGQIYEDMVRGIHRKVSQAQWVRNKRNSLKGLGKSDEPSSPAFRKLEAAGVKALEDGDEETFNQTTETRIHRIHDDDLPEALQ